jgi:hypothetical protein
MKLLRLHAKPKNSFNEGAGPCDFSANSALLPGCFYIEPGIKRNPVHKVQKYSTFQRVPLVELRA